MNNEGNYRWHWMQVIFERMYQAFEDACIGNEGIVPEYISNDMNFDDGCFVEVEMERLGKTNINLYHKEIKNERSCPNVEQYILDNLPNWDEFYELYCENNRPTNEWIENGFRDEADYWRYRLG